MKMPTRASLGFGLGLRVDHYEAILAERPAIDWFEVLTENYLVPGGKPLHYLGRIREHYPLVMHGVSMSIGSTAPLDREYLAQVKRLAQRIEPEWISDHLCWTGVAGKNMHDLLPLPYTEEALAHVAQRVRTVQDILDRRILLESGVINQNVHRPELVANGLEHLGDILFIRNVGAISERRVAVAAQLIDHRLRLVFASDIINADGSARMTERERD